MQDTASTPPTSASSCEYTSLQVNINERLRFAKSRSLAPTEEELQQPTKRLRPTMDGFKPLHILRRTPPIAYPPQTVHEPIIYVASDPPTPTNYNPPPDDLPPEHQPTLSPGQPTRSHPATTALSSTVSHHVHHSHGRPPDNLPQLTPPTSLPCTYSHRSASPTADNHNDAPTDPDCATRSVTKVL